MNATSDPDGLVTAYLAASEFEAQTVAAILRDREIDVAVFSAAIGTLGLDAVGARLLGGIPVQVRMSDLERANDALRENKFLSDSVDWDSVDVGNEDAEATALVRTGAIDAMGSAMVRGGRIAAIALVALSLVVWVARCS